MCADFCSDIKSLWWFLGAAYDKKSVCVRWLQSDKKSEWRHPTMRPRLLLSHTIALIKNRSVCADFWSEKKSVRFFLGAACNKKIGRLRWLSPKKNRTFTPTFSRSSLRQKIGPCALGITMHCCVRYDVLPSFNGDSVLFCFCFFFKYFCYSLMNILTSSYDFKTKGLW